MSQHHFAELWKDAETNCLMEPKSDSADRLWGALRPLLARLQTLAQTDATVRAELAAVAHALLTLTAAVDHADGDAPAATPPLAISTADPVVPAASSALPAPPLPAADIEPVPALTTDQRAAQPALPQASEAPSTAQADQAHGLPTPVPIPEEAHTLPEQGDPIDDRPPDIPDSASTTVTPLRGAVLAALPPEPAREKPKGNPPSRRALASKVHPAPQAGHLRAVYVTPAAGFVDQPFQAQRVDLETIATSCALKADAARWMRERQRLLSQGKSMPTELAAQKWKLIEHAQTLPECYLWMLHQEPAATVDPALYDNLGNCYEACAMIAGLLDKLMAHERQSQPALIQALSIAALAQATLRNAIQLIDGGVDADQRKLYQWVEAAHSQYHLQMRRYTRRSKEANPALAVTLVQQVYELIDKLNLQRKRQNSQRRLWRNAQTLVQAIQAQPDTVTAPEWQQLETAIAALVSGGVPPSSVELRTLLLPLLDLLPDTMEQSKSFGLVLREIDHFLTQETEDGLPESGTVLSADVLRVRELLQGERVIFIGGERRLAAEAALCSAFGLQELIWLAGHDQTYTAFEPYVARPDVSVVILALRWSRHGFGQVKEYCDRYDKLFVRLLSGYNPNQVAHAILNQIGARLEQRAQRLDNRQDSQAVS